jgi:hemin uptake protein HemP
MNDDNQAANGDREPAPAATTWRSEELLRGAKEVLILHEGELYRLRCTRNGKLILQK